MEPWSTIAERWPNRVFEFRRRCAADPEFGSILSDYHEARSALDRWRRVDPASSVRIADYERLVRELELEIEHGLVAK